MTSTGPTAEPAAAPFTIGNVRFRDIRHVSTIQHASFRPGLAYSKGALITLWLMPAVTFLVARDPAGIAIGCIIGDRHQGHVRIMNLAVHPDWRRRGVGAALLRAIGERLPEGDIVLMVEEFNTAAQALYAREGFVRTGFANDYYGRNHNGIQMTLLRGPRSPGQGTPRRIMT
jgi:ribosomal-protein-alanine N-acetyltransferase